MQGGEQSTLRTTLSFSFFLSFFPMIIVDLLRRELCGRNEARFCTSSVSYHITTSCDHVVDLKSRKCTMSKDILFHGVCIMLKCNKAW